MLRRLLFTGALVMLGASFAAPVAAQNDEKKIWDGVYSDAQADRGKETFTGLCRRCHSDDLNGSERGPALRGNTFMSHWELQNVSRLFSKMRDAMPPDAPSSLPEEDYLNALTYVLRANGFPAGKEALTIDALDGIAIAPKPGEKPRELPNFAFVRVVGCLTEEPGNVWALDRASEPVATTEQSPTAQATSAATAQPLGAQTFRLMSVNSFEPASHKGEKMQARGLLYRAPNKDRINVVSLETVAARCDR